MGKVQRGKRRTAASTQDLKVNVCGQEQLSVRLYICICVPYISVMVSGRLVGISVSPFPLQSTMLLLQVQDSGHCNTLQEEEDDDW